jgi:F-box protein 21
MDSSTMRLLPNELLESIVYWMSPTDALSFGATCKQCNKITYEPLLWRRHCLETWRYWDNHHEIKEKIASPPAQVRWRELYNERSLQDKNATMVFDQLLLTQQYRMQRMEKIAAMGYDIKDLMLRMYNATPDDAEDVLARRYHAKAILGQLHRETALEKWTRLLKQQMVSLEEVLGAYDLFVLTGRRGDLSDISREFDRIAECIRVEDEEWEDRSIREKAHHVARWLRERELVGNPNEDDYHALRNNFISIALFDDVHTSLPLQSVAIYCAVARRLGINAKPSNYPAHVHAVIAAPPDKTLDGKARTPQPDEQPEVMHMDPWRSAEEVPREPLSTRLTQLGAPIDQHDHFLGPTSTLEVTLRTGRNIMNSVQEARDRQRGITQSSLIPDVEAAWYSMLWSMMILGDGHNAASAIQRRKQCLPYLIEHHQSHFPEDLGLIEKVVLPMFEGEREHHIIMHLITTARKADDNKKAPSPRDINTSHVKYKIGQQFSHGRYSYKGFIIGWDMQCTAEDRWIHQMRVDDLPKGRQQPFYNVV